MNRDCVLDLIMNQNIIDKLNNLSLNWNVIIGDIESGCDGNVVVIIVTSYAAKYVINVYIEIVYE